MQSQPPPKGSLEELFRHHLLESEAAAVPPRPLVWEQVDNSLLLAQNEKYRRRLLVHRWGMAASLLLAALAGGGWWHSQQVATATLASANAQYDAARRAVAGAVAPSRPASAALETAALTSEPASARRLASLAAFAEGSGASHPSASQGASLAASRGALAHLGHGHRQPGAAAGASPAGLAGRGYAEAAGTVAGATLGHSAQLARGGSQAARTLPTRTYSLSSPNSSSIAATTTSSLVDSPNTSLPVSQAAELATVAPGGTSVAENAPATVLTDSRMGEELLAGRLAALALTSAAAAGLPAELTAKELPTPAPTLLRHWRYGAEYAVSAFQPNIDFNRSTTDYNQALGSNTVSLTRAAAAEYRANLRPGLGQRLTLHATRWLGGHWSLSTGVEVAQQTAYSATSAAFTGEQLADVNNFSAVSPGPTTVPAYVSRELHESSFRYRSAGIPIELQYDNQAKSGVSFYGRLGAIVSALLSVRSEVAGNSEATRTYSITSASTPYRRLTALLRGSAGVRYRPAGRNWGLNMGPTAEAGVQSLNTETDRSFLQQSRPYSVGIEAGFEFGGGPKPVPAARY